MASYRISEAAQRTGFPASTLRYYEDVGLVVPARTPAGYREYDERSIDRLQFVFRAKQLGLPLEEIVELVSLWDGDRCEPVARRLHDFVSDRVAITEGRIAELAVFAAQLRSAVERLELPIDEGPCGPECACQADAGAVVATAGAPGAPAPVKLVTKGQADPPIACSLAGAEVPARLARWRRIVARASASEHLDGRMLFRFPSSARLAAEIAQLAAAEQECCPFYEFRLRLAPGEIELEVRAPAEAAELVAELFGVAS